MSTAKPIGLPTDLKWFLPPQHNIRIATLALDIGPIAFKLRFIVLPFWFWWSKTKDRHPSLADLGLWCRCTRRALVHALAELERAGLLRVESGAAHRHRNRYTLLGNSDARGGIAPSKSTDARRGSAPSTRGGTAPSTRRETAPSERPPLGAEAHHVVPRDLNRKREGARDERENAGRSLCACGRQPHPFLCGSPREEPLGEGHTHEEWDIWFKTLSDAEQQRYDMEHPQIEDPEEKAERRLEIKMVRQALRNDLIEWTDWERANLPSILDALSIGLDTDERAIQLRAALRKIEEAST